MTAYQHCICSKAQLQLLRHSANVYQVWTTA